MNQKAKVVLIASILIFLLIVGSSFARKKADDDEPVEKPGVAMQFVQSFSCILTQCGWPAIVLLILPAVAVFVWKKFFSWG